jgi:hypothetical protein
LAEYPTDFITTTPPLSGLQLVQEINDWLAGLVTNGSGATAPASPGAGRLWFDTTATALKLRSGGAWRTILHDGTSLALGATAAAARTTLDVAQKQSSLLDDTSGRGLVVGAFGLGGNGADPPNDRLNNISSSGIYRAGSDTLHKPGDASGNASSVIAAVWNSDRQAQIYLDTAANPRMFMRVKISGTWNSYIQVVTTENIGPRIADINQNSIGATIMARNNSGTDKTPGDTISGSNLNAASATTQGGSTFSGTWRCHGRAPVGETSVWVRVS